MRQMWRAGFVTVVGSLMLGQTSPLPPQSARQALIEMFMGKGADDFTKHLPDAARQILIHKAETPEISVALRISAISHDMAAQGGRVETFDEGPNILVSEKADSHERIEVIVEHDSLIGENDEIELSVHMYKDGQPQPLPVVPRLTFTLKQEKEIWRLTEVTVAAHVPLTDPDYLKGLRKEQDETYEAAARARMAIISQAETRYVANHPDRGYSCALSELFPPSSSSGEAGAYSSSGFTNEESDGYRFRLTACDGAPVSKYRLSAVPIDPDSEMKTFCADQSGNVKSVSAGRSSSCFSRARVVNGGPS
jgi:hypothetical protein